MKMERIPTLETMKYNTNKTVRDHILISKNFIPMKITASSQYNNRVIHCPTKPVKSTCNKYMY